MIEDVKIFTLYFGQLLLIHSVHLNAISMIIISNHYDDYDYQEQEPSAQFYNNSLIIPTKLSSPSRL